MALEISSDIKTITYKKVNLTQDPRIDFRKICDRQYLWFLSTNNLGKVGISLRRLRSIFGSDEHRCESV